MAPCIETFGAARRMFESNFPVDKAGDAHDIGWNAKQRIAGTSAAEEEDLFWSSAARSTPCPISNEQTI